MSHRPGLGDRLPRSRVDLGLTQSDWLTVHSQNSVPQTPHPLKKIQHPLQAFPLVIQAILPPDYETLPRPEILLEMYHRMVPPFQRVKPPVDRRHHLIPYP